jgi:outer membrane protein TolC
MIRLFAFLFLGIVPSAWAAERLSIKDAIDRALRQNKDLRATMATVLQSEADRDRAAGEFGLKIEGTAAVAPITAAHGDATLAVEDKDTWGRAYIGNFKAIQPLYTFGRKSDYVDAAEHGIRVKQGDVRLREAEVRYQVKEAYYGFLYAKSLLDQIQGGKKDLDGVIEKSEKSKKKRDTFQLQILAQELVAKEAEVEKYLDLAREGLRLRLGESDTIFPKEDWLRSEPRPLHPVDWYLFHAREHRPEFEQLREGVEAKRLLARAEKKALLPVIALGATYEFADTNVRTPQPGPFAWDPYNRDAASIGLGFQWTFQWGLSQAKAAKFAAEASELEAKQAFAQEGLLLEVKKAYWEAGEAATKLAAATEAYKTGKRWFTREMAGFSAGVGETKDLVSAYGARASTTKNYLEAIHEHHLAWARLSRAIGAEVDPLMQ